MKRYGIVVAINTQRGMVAIKTQDDGYTIIELLSDFELAIGDEMAWESGHELGVASYQNLSNQTSEEVYVQNHAVSEQLLRQQLLLTP